MNYPQHNKILSCTDNCECAKCLGHEKFIKALEEIRKLSKEPKGEDYCNRYNQMYEDREKVFEICDRILEGEKI